MYLGLDLGTSGMRALLLDETGEILGSASQAYGVQNPHPGWSEQDPADWTAAITATTAQLRAEFPRQFAALRAIAVSGHMHGATLIGADGAVLRPCILWNDTRSHLQAAALDASPNVRALSGNIVFPGFTAPKLLWVEQNEPEIFRHIDKVLLPAAYANFWLTGRAVADMSDSAGTSWLDVGARDWSAPLLDAGHMRRDQMPDLVEGSAPAGTLRADLADAWGVARDVIVTGGAGDNAASACGVGALAEGQGFVSLGTSGVLLAARAGYHPLPASAVHTFCHAIPETWYQMGVILSATDSLNWLARITGQKPAALSAALGDSLQPPAATQFLPYLSGERTPHNDAKTRGAFLGLDVATDTADLTRAVMTGVAFALRDCLGALTQTGANLQTVLAIGGGTASPYWVRLLATVLDMPLALPVAGDFGAALGAARLAQCGATGATPRTVMTAPAIDRVITPDASQTQAYADAYQTYRAAYPAIKDIP